MDPGPFQIVIEKMIDSIPTFVGAVIALAGVFLNARYNRGTATQQSKDLDARARRERAQADLREIIVHASSAYRRACNKLDAEGLLGGGDSKDSAFEVALLCHAYALVSAPELRECARKLTMACADADAIGALPPDEGYERLRMRTVLDESFVELEQAVIKHADKLAKS